MKKIIKHASPVSRAHLGIFILVFIVIGGIVIWRSLAAPNPALPGDLNNDNTVNIQDMSILLSNFNTSSSTADINGDGTVNILDLSILLSHYGQSISVGNLTTVGINAGGTAAGSFGDDANYSGGSISSYTSNVDTSAVTNPAPQAVYQSVRYGTFSYTIGGFTANSSASVRLHFAEIYFTANGQRVFNVSINGSQVLSNFDIVAAAGAANKAVIKSFNTTANSSGQVVISFSSVVDQAEVNGLEVSGTAAASGGGGGGGGNASLGTSLPTRLPQSSGGATYYVDGTNGNDGNSGSSASPWQSINKALNTVPLSGSVIRVRPGTYNSNGGSYALVFGRAGSTTNPVTLMADQPGTVTIANGNQNASTYGAWIHDSSGLRVQGITFKITNSPALDTGGDSVLIENSDWIEFTNCVFNEAAQQGIAVRGGGYGSGQTADNIWIINNVFRPSGSNPNAQVTGVGYPSTDYYGSRGSHWIYAGQWGSNPGVGQSWDQTNGANKLVIANNVFTGATAGYDIELGPETRNGFVVNNTFYGNTALQTIGVGDPANYNTARLAGDGIMLFSNTGTSAYSNGNNIITNNIFSNLFGHAAYGSGPTEPGNIVQKNLGFALSNNTGYDGAGVDYLTYYGSTSVVLFSTGSGNYAAADPLFVGPGSYNYQLQAGSPAIGKADPAYTYPYDITGKARDSAPDLGAYEQ